MKNTSIERKITDGNVIFYRRVSTKKQHKSDYKNQLNTVKQIYPDFCVSHDNTTDQKEVMSGRADLEKRIGGKLGSVLKLLKRSDDTIMIVASADRIARRTDVFKGILKQGLGDRIFDASSGKSLTQIVASNEHAAIEERTEKQRKSCLIGMAQYQRNGGTMGRTEIRKVAKQGAMKQHKDCEERRDAVFGEVRKLVIQGRGQRPSHSEICDALDLMEIRTGQGRPFTKHRLTQFIKDCRSQWAYALDSYSRPRRRINRLIRFVLLELRNKRLARRKRPGLERLSNGKLASECIDVVAKDARRKMDPVVDTFTILRAREQDGCRGPPPSLHSSLGGDFVATVNGSARFGSGPLTTR